MSLENLKAQLFFKFDDRLGYTRLRSKQRLGRIGQAEIMANRFPNSPAQRRPFPSRHARCV